jgi:NhaA family Na+:H+ antiporter
MASELLTFIFFLLIGLELRAGLTKPKDVVLPALAALGGMALPALIFIGLHPHSQAWAVAMPTDVALAIGALSILGKRVNPSVRLFLLTLAIADDFFSLILIGIFFRSDLNLASAIYTLGAAAIGFLLPKRDLAIKVLAPVATFLVIPIYLWINLLSKLDFSQSGSSLSFALIVSRVLGKVLGISLIAWVITRRGRVSLPAGLSLKEIVGVGFLAGMGLTVSIVIAIITLRSATELSQVRVGLFFAALISGALGLIWLKSGAPRQD